MIRIDKLETSLDLMGGGAWPFLVLGVICLLNCDNGRDLNLLNRWTNVMLVFTFLEGLLESIQWKFEATTGL
jgi:hypothetical protein